MVRKGRDNNQAKFKKKKKKKKLLRKKRENYFPWVYSANVEDRLIHEVCMWDTS